jgi:chaperonin GroES
MHVRPLHDRLLVRRFENDEQQIGLIVIPDAAREKPQRGTVIAAGAGRIGKEGQRLALDVKAGDTILFGKYSGHEVTLDGVAYLIMNEGDVLATEAIPDATASTGHAAATLKEKKH